MACIILMPVDSMPFQRFDRNIKDAIVDIYPELTDYPLPAFISFGSWIGGDRDGNPFVTHYTTQMAVSCMLIPCCVLLPSIDQEIAP